VFSRLYHVPSALEQWRCRPCMQEQHWSRSSG